MHFFRQVVQVAFFGWIVFSNVSGWAQTSLFPDRIIEYTPAPGQFINTAIGCPYAAQSLVGGISSGISLGSFGGYVILGYDHPVENDPQNPYGVDFTVFGNAAVNSSEPGAVWVMKDENKNGLPDDTWYLLAGSDYWFTTSVHRYDITYTNPRTTEATDVVWQDNLGNSGVIPANEFHTQPYYPLTDSFPLISDENYTLYGELIRARIDSSNSAYVISAACSFGYADNRPRNFAYSGYEPDNPYTPESEGSGGDAFDISWAVDDQGQYVDLDQVDFIKIQTAVNQQAGWIGELSTEVLGVVDVEPASLTGADELMVIQPVDQNPVVGEPLQLHAFYFICGKVQKEASFSWTVNHPEWATVDDQGVLDAQGEGELKVYAALTGTESPVDSLTLNVVPATSVNQILVNRVIIYPNPATDVLFVQNLPSNSTVELINMSGIRQTVYFMSPNRINLNGLESGIYILKIHTDSGNQTLKFVKR